MGERGRLHEHSAGPVAAPVLKVRRAAMRAMNRYGQGLARDRVGQRSKDGPDRPLPGQSRYLLGKVSESVDRSEVLAIGTGKDGLSAGEVAEAWMAE